MLTVKELRKGGIKGRNKEKRKEESAVFPFSVSKPLIKVKGSR